MRAIDLEKAADALLDAACPAAEKRRALDYPWLMPQCFRRRWRREYPLTSAFRYHDPPHPGRVEDDLIRAAEVDEKRALISAELDAACIPREERECLVLPAFGFSDEDIAFVTGLNITTISLRRKRALLKLAERRAEKTPID